MLPASLLNGASIALIVPTRGNLFPPASTSSICGSSSGLQACQVFEVAFFGYCEINPHHAVIGQGREDVPLLDQAAQLLVQAVDDAVERCSDVGTVQFANSPDFGALARAIASEGALASVEFDSAFVRFALAPDLGRFDLEHRIALLHRLALLD